MTDGVVQVAGVRDDDNEIGASLVDGGESSADTAGIEPGDAIRVLMSFPVASVEPSVSLMELAATLETEAVGAVAVMSRDHLDGVVSERDIVRALSVGEDPANVCAGDVMAAEPIFVDPDEPIIAVAERMLDEGVRHVAIVSDGDVVGVVSVRDPLRVLVDAWRRAHMSEAQQKGA